MKRNPNLRPRRMIVLAMEITNNYSNYTSGYASAANTRKQTAESKEKVEKT